MQSLRPRLTSEIDTKVVQGRAVETDDSAQSMLAPDYDLKLSQILCLVEASADTAGIDVGILAVP